MARMQIVSGSPDVVMDVVVPDSRSAAFDIGRTAIPVAWLLHPEGGNSGDFLRFTQAEWFAEKQGIILCCVSGENGYFTDTAAGIQWESNLTGKLWNLFHSTVPCASHEGEKNFIAGYGMGGYGAVLLALRHTGLFSQAVSFAGSLDFPQRFSRGEAVFSFPCPEEVFGDPKDVSGSSRDLFTLIRNPLEKKPRFLLYGDEADLSSSALRESAESAGIGCELFTSRGPCDWEWLNDRLREWIETIEA